MTDQTNAAVNGMLPNGRAASSADVQIIPEDKLDKSSIKVAIKAIDNAYTIQWGKDGILDTQVKLNGLKDKVSEQVYSIVKEAVKIAGNDMLMARQVFLSLCAVAETHIKSKHIEKKEEDLPMGQLIPSWANYKSEMSKGLQAGLNPEVRAAEGGALKYPTGDAFRKAAQLATSPNGTGSQAGQTRANTAGSPVLELTQRGFTVGLAAGIQVLLDTCSKLNQGQQDRAAKLIVELAGTMTKWPAEAEAHAKEVDKTAREHAGVNPRRKAA